MEQIHGTREDLVKRINRKDVAMTETDPSTYTNARSSGIKLDRPSVKALSQRSDRPGLIYLARWAVLLAATGTGVWFSLETVWIWPAMVVHGIALTVPVYAISHETAHSTAFRNRRLNEIVFWVTSLLYMEEPLHRRHTHASHHAYTYHVGKDAQIPFDLPMDFWGWLIELSGFGLLRFHCHVLWRLASGRPTDVMRDVSPPDDLPRMIRNARIFVAVYAGVGIAIALGVDALLWFLVLPRFLGGPVMLAFTLMQHAELAENARSILDSTRSFRTNALARFLYANMNNHIEHHLYPQIPFHALPALADAIRDQVPEPDPGFIRTHLEVLSVVVRRTLGRNTRARSIRQAPHMVTDGGFERLAPRSM